MQEIGREINTTGAKAYDSSIQKCVVMMKDELEKAKEQILNVSVKLHKMTRIQDTSILHISLLHESI